MFKHNFSSCLFSESVDVQDRERRDNAAEAGLRAAATPELLLVAGVLTDLNRHKKPSENKTKHERALHCPPFSCK